MKKFACCIFLFIVAITFVFASGGGDKGQKSITMWMQNYGDDLPRQQRMMSDLAAKFEKESGIKVNIEISAFSEAARKWLLVATGGDHPDVGDMFQAWSHVQIGKGKAGPLPLDQYKAQLHQERFIPSTLVDVTFDGKVYGIPWRSDVRPMWYRADLFAQAGLPGPPDTWDDLVNYGKKLTVKAADGRIEISGVGFTWGVKNNAQDFMHWIWQGGGEVMTRDGKTALINSKEVIDAMQFVRDLVHKHEVVTKEVLDPTYDGHNMFISGKVAIRPMATSTISDFSPEMLAKVKPAIPTKGVTRTAYSGSGYMGALYGTKAIEESVKWLEFLTRDENQLALAQMSLQYSPSKGASADAYFSNDEWKSTVIKCLEFSHPTQHANGAWVQISAYNPGSPIYDFWADTLLNREPIPGLAAKYHAVTQDMMDKANANN
ncbi:sugar ABC transporter substrate-binding protein [Spirochaetia bacterium]|nr:sugar ABC transporter substrate-binding protein [Spirochaetia bacterium]